MKKKTCIGSCGWNGIILYDSKVCGLNFFLFFQVVSYYIYLNLSTQRKRIELILRLGWLTSLIRA